MLWDLNQEHSAIALLFDQCHNLALELLMCQIFFAVLSEDELNAFFLKEFANQVNGIALIEFVQTGWFLLLHLFELTLQSEDSLHLI